jgi:hypothetical protein
MLINTIYPVREQRVSLSAAWSESTIARKFGDFDSPSDQDTQSSNRVLYNSDLPRAARQLSQFDWAVYSFNSGHFVSSIRSWNLPFNVTLARDPYSQGRALFKEFTGCNSILSGAAELLNHVRSSGHTSVLHGYPIHSHRFASSDATRKFWEIQSSIMVQLRLIRSLSIVIAIVHPDHDGNAVKIFLRNLKKDSWIITVTDIFYPDYGDSVSGHCKILIGVHQNTESVVEPLNLKTPPKINPDPLATYLWAPFNTPQSALSFAKDDPRFNKDAVPDSGIKSWVASVPKASDASVQPPALSICYHLHREDMDQTNLTGAAVYSLDSLCPPFESAANENLFQHYFGIEYRCEDRTFVRAFSPFEFVSCFKLVNDITYHLSHPKNKYLMDAAVPGMTSVWLFDHILERLIQIRDSNC